MRGLWGWLGRAVMWFRSLFRRKPPAPEIDPAHGFDRSQLHVVAVFFNFRRFRNPVLNFRRFVDHMRQLGVTLHVVELALGDAAFQVTDPFDPHHTRLRTDTEFFQKENLVNIGVRGAIGRYPDLKYLAWIDADVTFFNPNVVTDTLYLLQRHQVVQMWAKAIDLGPEGHPLEIADARGKQGIVSSFGYSYHHGLDRAGYYGTRWHPGYAWAMRRSTWEALGGLYETSVLGAADHHMAWAFAGKPRQGIHGQASEGYKRDALAWCGAAAQVVGGDVGYTPGLVHHAWHGRKEDRKYVERWDILVRTGYDPALDLTRDANGLLHLTGRSPELRAGILAYFEQRNEDANTRA